MATDLPFSFDDTSHGIFASVRRVGVAEGSSAHAVTYNEALIRLIGMGENNTPRLGHQKFLIRLGDTMPEHATALRTLFVNSLHALLQEKIDVDTFTAEVNRLRSQSKLECARDLHTKPNVLRVRMTAYNGRPIVLKSTIHGTHELACELDLVFRLRRDGGVVIVDSMQGMILEIEHVFSRYAEQTGITDSVRHLLKPIINLIGAEHARAGLTALRATERQFTTRENAWIQRACRSLSLHAGLRSLGELMRAATLCRALEYDKLQKWCNATSLDEWRQGSQAMLDNYRRQVKWYVASICFARGLRTFTWYEHDGATCEVDAEAASHDTVGEVFRGPRGRLAPFSLAYGPDSHLALLSALLEPTVNAVRYLKEQCPRGVGRQLRIVFDPAIPECIRVHVGNTVAEVPDAILTPGLMKSGKLLDECALAHYECTRAGLPQRTDDNDHLFWVTVVLHPQQLVERIVKVEG